MKEIFLEVFLPVFLFIGGGLLLIIAMVLGVDYIACRGFERGTGIEARWYLGCYVKVGDDWVPKEYVFGGAHEIRLKDKK